MGCRGSGESGVWPGRTSHVEGAAQHDARWRQAERGGARVRSAWEACWGTTPLPSAVSWAGRPSPGVSVTQPGARPCIHSTNRGLRRPASSVGRGAGRVTVSHRATAAAYGPQAPVRPSAASARRTAGVPQPAVEAGSMLPVDGPVCRYRPPVVSDVAGPPPRARSSPHCRNAGSVSPWCRPTPSAWAGATPPRRPGSGHGRPACAWPGADCRRWRPGCWSGSSAVATRSAGQAARKIRSRRCGAPTSEARSTHQRASNRRSAREPSTAPSARTAG